MGSRLRIKIYVILRIVFFWQFNTKILTILLVRIISKLFRKLRVENYPLENTIPKPENTRKHNNTQPRKQATTRETLTTIRERHRRQQTQKTTKSNPSIVDNKPRKQQN